MPSDIIFSDNEKEFLLSNECCRVATCHNNIPHVVPVSYIFAENSIYFATDRGTKKYRNITKNGKIALVIDVYSSAGNKAIFIQGNTRVIDRGDEFHRIYRIFYKQFEWVRQDPWTEGEAPFIKVMPYKKISWGINNK